MFERVILAIDGSKAGPVATSFAVGVVKASRAPGRIHVVHVNEYLVGGRGYTVETEDEAAEVVARAVADVRAAGLDASGEIRLATCFNVASTIAHAAAAGDFDAIVVGHHGRRHLGPLSFGGVREQLTRITSLPVVVAPPPIDVRPRRGHRLRASAERRPTRATIAS